MQATDDCFVLFCAALDVDPEPQRRLGECDLTWATWDQTYLAPWREGEL